MLSKTLWKALSLSTAHGRDDGDLVARLDGPGLVLIHIFHVDSEHGGFKDVIQSRMAGEELLSQGRGGDPSGPFKGVRIGLGGVLGRCEVEDCELVGGRRERAVRSRVNGMERWCLEGMRLYLPFVSCVLEGV